jgi:hypothetical protein
MMQLDQDPSGGSAGGEMNANSIESFGRGLTRMAVRNWLKNPPADDG